jgi:phosphoglycerate dehydrogenase-like enzyme
VANNGGGNSWAVAEHTVALILALYRRLLQCDRSTRQGTWRDAIMDGMNTYLLADKSVGIVGLGRIGKKVARRLKPFETRLIYNDLLAFPDYERELAMPRVSLDELLRRSDIVTLHVPLTSKTRGFIGRRGLFELMKPTAILINTCRGPVVDEPVLIEALKKGRIRGAGLDVFEREPINPDNPLLKLENVVLTPHGAGGAYEGWFRQADFAFGNIMRVYRGLPPESVVTSEE